MPGKLAVCYGKLTITIDLPGLPILDMVMFIAVSSVYEVSPLYHRVLPKGRTIRLWARLPGHQVNTI